MKFVIILSYVTSGIAMVHEDDLGDRGEPQLGWIGGSLAQIIFKHLRNMGMANFSEMFLLVS